MDVQPVGPEREPPISTNDSSNTTANGNTAQQTVPNSLCQLTNNGPVTSVVQPTQPDLAVTAGNFANLEVQDSRRKGLYGAEEFRSLVQLSSQTRNVRDISRFSILGKAGTDLDRDENGELYAGQKPIYPFDCSVVAAGGRSHIIQPSESALHGGANKKRKHAHVANDILPPSPFIWRGTKDPNFNVFHGILLYPELCFILVAHLPLRDLISLYSISRDFHAIIDTRFTTTCLTVAGNKARESSYIYHFRMYAHLCRPDPANRIPHPDPVKAAASQPRMIPSFRWVAFVLFREKVVHELMAVFAENGVPLPKRCSVALKRMWLIMDIPDNARRIGLIHNRTYFPDVDLYFLFCFFVKLDMLCHDPLAAEKHTGLRKMLLSQQDGLLTMLLVLKRIKWRHQADLVLAWVRYTYEVTTAHDTDNFDPISFGAETIFGVPIKEAGLGKYEYWGKRGAIHHIVAETGQRQRYGILMRPDQLVMREAVRRQLKFSKVVLKSVLCSYIDDHTLESLPAKPFPRRIPEWAGEEYGVDDLVGGASALDPEYGGDPLLDLGDTDTGAPLVVKSDLENDIMAKCTRTRREMEEHFLEQCMNFCGREFPKLDQDDPISHEELAPLP